VEVRERYWGMLSSTVVGLRPAERAAIDCIESAILTEAQRRVGYHCRFVDL